MRGILKFMFLVAAMLTVAPHLSAADPLVTGVVLLVATPIVLNLVTPYVNTGILGANTIGARLVYENAKVALNKAFPLKPGEQRAQASELVKLTQGFLRLERAIAAGITSYEFPMFINQVAQQQGIMFNTEYRLNQQDSFITSEVGIFLGAPASSVDASFLLDTYPNPDRYGANAVPMQAVYNGSLNVTVNGDILIPIWDLTRHYYAPETQATAAPGVGSPIDQKRLSDDGFYPMEPNVVFIGSKKNTIKIDLPAAPASFLANSRIIIMFRGVLAQNSTVVS